MTTLNTYHKTRNRLTSGTSLNSSGFKFGADSSLYSLGLSKLEYLKLSKIINTSKFKYFLIKNKEGEFGPSERITMKSFNIIFSISLSVAFLVLASCGMDGNKLGTCSVNCYVPNGYDIVQYTFITEEQCREKGQNKGCPSRFCPPGGGQDGCYEVYHP